VTENTARRPRHVPELGSALWGQQLQLAPIRMRELTHIKEGAGARDSQGGEGQGGPVRKFCKARQAHKRHAPGGIQGG